MISRKTKCWYYLILREKPANFSLTIHIPLLLCRNSPSCWDFSEEISEWIPVIFCPLFCSSLFPKCPLQATCPLQWAVLILIHSVIVTLDKDQKTEACWLKWFSKKIISLPTSCCFASETYTIYSMYEKNILSCICSIIV